jgi:hypothetical protein
MQTFNSFNELAAGQSKLASDMSVFNHVGVIQYFDVNSPLKVHPGGMVVIGGDAPLWKFCNLFHQCIVEGAKVVAAGVGVDKSQNHNDYTVAYSLDEDYPIGSPIPVDLVEEDDLGDLPEF